jgi:hypothetical protein
MKIAKFLLAIGLSLIASSASAQWGLKATCSRMTFNTMGTDYVLPALSMTGFGIGVLHNFNTGVKGLSLRPGLRYMYTTDKTRKPDDLYQMSDYLNSLWTEQSLRFTIDVKYAVEAADNFKVYAFAGLGLVLGITFTERFEFTRYDMEAITATHNMYTGVTKSNWDSIMLDGLFTTGLSNFGLIAKGGLGVQYKWVFAEIDYVMDIINRNTRVKSTSKIKANVLTASLGVMF